MRRRKDWVDEAIRRVDVAMSRCVYCGGICVATEPARWAEVCLRCLDCGNGWGLVFIRNGECIEMMVVGKP